MKALMFAAPLLLIGSTIGAQPVTIDNVSAPVEYYRMPDYPLKASYTTYTSEMDVRFREIANSGYTVSTLRDRYLKLEGYKLVTTRGDVEIEAAIGDFTNWGEYHKTSRTKNKDKVEVVRYYLELRYSMPMSIMIMDKEGNRLLDQYVFQTGDIRTWVSPSRNSLSELDSYWRIERQHRINALQKERIEEGMKKIYDLINDNFGYLLINDKITFETIGKKKHELYEKYQANVELLKEAFKTMDADHSLDAIKTKIKPALTFYASEAAKYTKPGKDEERLKHISIYNQAAAYLWTEEFDKATEHANALKKMNAKDKDAKRLLEEIEYVQSSLHRAGKTSRHRIKVGA